MLGIILLIGICYAFWRSYAELAHEYNRPRTGFGLLGVGLFIVSYILGAVICVLMLFNSESLTGDAATGLAVEGICIAFGALVAYVVYRMLKNSWVKTGPLEGNSEILDN